MNTFLGRLFTPCSQRDMLACNCDMRVMTAALPSSQVIMKIREKGPGQHPAPCGAAEMGRERVRQPQVSWETHASPWRWTWWAEEGESLDC